MELRFLQEFCSLAESLNYTITAERFFTTEASLSRHIKKLEEEIGGQLFVRTTRRVEISPLGTALLPYAQKLVAGKIEMDEAIAKALGKGKTNLSIAAIAVSNEYLNLHHLLELFGRKHPDISIDIQTPNIPITKIISRNICELGFVPELAEYENPQLRRVLIRRDRIIALIPRRSPLAGCASVSLSDLKNEKLILISNGSPMFELCNQACQMYGFDPKVVLTMSSGNSIRSVVEKDMGVGLLLEYPSALLHKDFPKGKDMIFMPLDPPVPVNFNLVYSQNLSEPAKIFVRFVKSHLGNNRQSP